MRRWRDDRSCNSAPTLNWRRGARAAAAGTECATAPTCPEGAKEGSQGPARPRFPGEAIQLRADAAPPPVSGAVAEALPRSAGQPGPARSARPRKCRKVLTGRPDDPTDDLTTRRPDDSADGTQPPGCPRGIVLPRLMRGGVARQLTLLWAVKSLRLSP